MFIKGLAVEGIAEFRAHRSLVNDLEGNHQLWKIVFKQACEH